MKVNFVSLSVLLLIIGCLSVNVQGQEECSAEGEWCDGNCCDVRDACTLSENGVDYYCVRQECKPLNNLCNHPIQCCSEYCQAIGSGFALCREKPQF